MWWWVKWIAAAAILVVLAVATPEAVKLAVLLSTPLKCGEELDATETNKRGDVAAENLRVCFGLGAFVDYSITLQRKKSEKAIKLVEYAPTLAEAPVKLRWIDDDLLMIDLGEVRSIWSRVDRVGPIHITYTYSKKETSWW